jgi:(p)ppGpp synthase/HD superfamily hydrolase
MVETMEMGLNALIAGAFHYCSCVEARQKQMLLPAYDDPLSPWEFSPHQGLESFGDHVMQIERDAHRLKRLEVLASMVVQNSNSNAAATTTTSSISDPSTTAAANLQNLYMTEARDWRALAIRGAACLYRLRGIIKSMSPAHQLSRESNRVCREALHIYAPLASRLGMHRLKNELEHAAFRLLYKRQHRTVESLLHQRRQRGHSSQYKDVKDGGRLLARVHQADGQLVQSNELVEQPDIGESMEQILEQVQKEMTEILENDAVFVSSVAKFEVSARVKEGYSTWRKMLRNGLDHILQVPDALALRIVLDAKKEWDGESVAVTRARERALCYYAQQLCMNVWRPYADNPRFKDYIAKPKENGYQSLHYTATTPFNGEQWMMEVQIRSGEMHKVAEFGVASHWNYKARSRSSSQMKKLQSFSSSQPSYRPNGSPIRIEMSPEEHFGKAMADHNTDAYLRSLQDWHWHQHGSPVDYNPLFLFDEAEHQERADRIRARTQRLAPYIEALASAQSDLQKQSVFVFLSAHHDEERNKDNANCSLLGDGMVVALPAGAVVMDAIRKCEFPDEVAARLEETVTHNGSPAILSTRLQNGDVLSIPAAAPCLTPV